MTIGDEELVTAERFTSFVRAGHLKLRFRQFHQLPLGFGKLARGAEGPVRYLDLSQNELGEVSSEIGDFSDLEFLDLSGNRLTTLPAAIGRLRKLRTLVLNENMIRHLPGELADLDSLESLELRDNDLHELPECVLGMPHLQLLDLRENELSELETSAAALFASDCQVRLEGNPFKETLAGLVGRGQRAVAHYVASLDDAVKSYEAKMQVVGEGNVGKTSLLAALRGEAFVEGRNTTHGIEIDKFVVSHPDGKRRITLRTWDFGGQEVYRITHQFFFSRRSLYLVAWNPRDGHEQDFVEAWIRRVRLRAGSGAVIIVVATHSDERRPEIDILRLQAMFPDLVLKSAEIDSKSGNGIDSLRNQIAALTAEFPQMGQMLSPRWSAVRDVVQKVASTEPQISFERFTEMCNQHNVLHDAVATVAEWLHELGQIVHYADDEGLRDVVVLNPEWVTNAISRILEDSDIRTRLGVLQHSRLSLLWGRDNSEGPGYPSHYHPYFLRLMEKFDVSYRLTDGNSSLVAQLVPFERASLPWSHQTSVDDGLRALRLTCALSEPAPGLISWLTVRHHRCSVDMHWRNGVFLRHPIFEYRSEALIELASPTSLKLEVRAPSPDMFFNVIRDSAEDLIRTRWPGLQYELRVPCPGNMAGSCPGEFPLHSLRVFLDKGDTVIRCPYCYEQHAIAALLTGFVPPVMPLAVTLVEVQNSIHSLDAKLSVAAGTLNRVLRAVTTEIVDCPRLLTISPTANTSKLFTGQMSYEIVLWCEHPDHWHPVEGGELAVGRDDGGRFLVPLNDYLVEVGGFGGVECLQAEVVDLSRIRDKSTYSDVSVIPRLLPGIG